MNQRKRIFPLSFSFILVLSVFFALSIIRPIALFDNLGFESDLSGWTNGDTVLISSGETVATNQYSWTVYPYGTKMARLQPSGTSGVFSGIADTLMMSQESRDYIVSVFPSITNVAYVYTDLELAEGESFTMAWNYISIDYVPFNDASITTFINIDNPTHYGLINQMPAPVSILGATVPGTGNYSTGSYSSTGWQSTSYTATTAGTYRLGFVIYNLDDTAYSPVLFVDELPGTTLRNGEEFEPIRPDDNPPPPFVKTAPVISELGASGIMVESALLELTIENDGGDEITECGFYVATHNNPTADDTKLSGSCDVGENYAEFLTGVVNTTYYYRAFATNSVGTTVSEVSQFTTLKHTPTLTLDFIDDKTYGDASFDLSASTSSTSVVLYASSDPEIASIDGNTVTIHKAGNVTITASVAENNEYYSLSTSQSFSIAKKDLVVTVLPSQKTYGNKDPQFEVEFDGLVYADTASSLNGDLLFGREDNENIGTYQVTAAGLTSDNYTIAYEYADLVILPRQLVVIVTPASKIYGSNDPKFSVTYRGFAFDDQSSLVQGLKIARKAGESVGSYPIVASNASAENYVIAYENAQFSIRKKVLTITVNDLSKVYGDAEPEYTVVYDGFVFDDDAEAISGLTINRDSGENVGDYVLSVSQASAANYQLSFVNGKLTISKAPLTLKANDFTKIVGEDDPAFTFTAQGLKNNDTASVVKNVTYDRETGEKVATYKISITGGKADNYTLTMTDGSLTIEKKPGNGLPVAGLIAGGFATSGFFFLLFLFKRKKKQDEQ